MSFSLSKRDELRVRLAEIHDELERLKLKGITSTCPRCKGQSVVPGAPKK